MPLFRSTRAAKSLNVSQDAGDPVVVELIAQAGGGLVEGYPHDTGGVRKKNSAFLYNGTRTMYEREGFTYDRPKGQGNCVMVREVAPSTPD